MSDFTPVSWQRGRQTIAEAAYFIAERRCFSGGDPVANWVEAERAVDDQLGMLASARIRDKDLGCFDSTKKLGSLGWTQLGHSLGETI